MLLDVLVNSLVKVTRNYQITVPATVREKLGIKEGDLVRIVYDESEGVAKNHICQKEKNHCPTGQKNQC
ncbi:MAG: AbrB/MazE/SpoVT family DNA-binding domain-containing protein [Thermoprotei archaeon]|nr:MAG: AbrB/MazE/SpoVT family DNA-binding domain-containing protein [Thermoprotei archaeon]